MASPTRDATATATRGPLGKDEVRRLNAYWRAANYLSVGQIYLLDNPLLREPRAESTDAGDPQFGRRRPFPPGGVNRPPLNNPQANRQPGANQARKQRLQRVV